ncbi:hypothetical protein EY643_05390 [Halioglobus maricola]|uniref:Uncharacterized protein n=1 Tax=Halioglobus maricola TaxID=2601894 RepID=A0A5P9NH21_9GAMM|nr:hypothetical protein [Halioglobus maricola]QFU75127.1 hypothetical protein EY643_05390 [Halioglobus maricola]
MTAEGMLEVAFVTWGNVATMMGLLISVISGYLVVAFVAGERMTRSQVVLVNIFYGFISGFLTWALHEMSHRAAIIETAGYNLASGEVAKLTARDDIALLLVMAFSLTVVGSYKFMWDIRHPKTE